MALQPFKGIGSTKERRKFWDELYQAVLSLRKLAGRNATVSEHPTEGTVVDVYEIAQRRHGPGPVVGAGACCFRPAPNAPPSCIFVTEAVCTAGGHGIFMGVGVLCEDVDCTTVLLPPPPPPPPPPGNHPCCIDGECTDVMDCADCAGICGDPGTGCSEVDCTDVGACCTDGSCSDAICSQCTGICNPGAFCDQGNCNRNGRLCMPPRSQPCNCVIPPLPHPPPQPPNPGAGCCSDTSYPGCGPVQCFACYDPISGLYYCCCCAYCTPGGWSCQGA